MKIDITKYEHVIWDWNGTLMDDIDLCKDLMNVFLNEQSLPLLSTEKYKQIFTFPVKDYYVKAGLKLGENSFHDFSVRFIDKYEKGKYDCNLHKDVNEVLSFIKSKKISQSILSAYSHNTLEEIVQFYGLRDYFIKLVGLNNIYAGSKLENGLNWIKELGVNPAKVVMIGDSVHDYDVATSMGTDCILVSHGHQEREKLTTTGVTVISSFSELLNDNN